MAVALLLGRFCNPGRVEGIAPRNPNLDYNPSRTEPLSLSKARCNRLSPADTQPTNPPDEPSNSPRNDRAEKWVLTKEAFDKLLEHFSNDRDEAAQRFELMRVKLIRFFEWRSCPLPEDAADTVVDRVARRIEEGQNIVNLNAYFMEVAHFVLLEFLKRYRTVTGLDDLREMPDRPPLVDEQKERRMSCLDECLEKLDRDSRDLILEYYQDDGRAKIERRKRMAAALGIPLNALRIRAHRIRSGLEKCVRNSLKSRNETGGTSL